MTVFHRKPHLDVLRSAQAQRMRKLLTLYRWSLAILALVIASHLVNAGTDAPLVPLLALVLLLATLALVGQVQLWRGGEAGPAQQGVMLAGDAVLLTGFFALGGMAMLPFMVVFVLHAGVAALFLTPIWAMGVFALTSLGQIALLVWAAPNPDRVADLFLANFLSASALIFMALAVRDSFMQRDRAHARLSQQFDEEQVVLRLGVLAAEAAHQISTPLTSLALTLEDWAEFGPPEAYRDAVAEMQQDLAACRNELSQMLALGAQPRMDAAEVMTAPEMVTDLLREWRLRHPDVDATLRDACQTPARIMVDMVLRKALINVLDNAAQAGARQIVITLYPEADRLALEIADDGPGLPEALLQGELPLPDPEHSSKGHGIGLMLVRAAVLRMGGALRVQNAPTGGACVTLVIPRLAVV